MSLDITNVLVHYGADLSRARQTGWSPIKCPFHTDRRASASVNLALGGFKCHACEMKGDAIAIIKEVEGLDYLGACDYARSVLGASDEDLPRPAKKPKRERKSARQRLFE